MHVLALDLGTRCGWAVFDGDRPVASGTWVLQKESQRKREGAGVKWLRLRALLDAVPESFPIGRVAYEDVKRHAGTKAAHAYGGALAVVQEWCEGRGLRPHGLAVGTIKKNATGKGNASKADMMAAARARWPAIAIEDDNHADALWIGDLASRK
jgi:crossover junction endodeoxyribonuclease RuvC